METQQNIETKLFAIQQALVMPKDQYNTFGKYPYRTCEGILEAVKPHLAKLRLNILMTDDLVLIGSRYYVRATASVIDIDTGDQRTVTAYAREEEDKKGMDQSQVTGASSSYARKYALCGLFAIDGSKDSDETSTKTPQDAKQGNKTAAPAKPAARQQMTQTAPTPQPASKPAPQPIPQPAPQQLTLQQLTDTQYFLSTNAPALRYYLKAQGVQDMTQLDLTAVYQHLKANNKINF